MGTDTIDPPYPPTANLLLERLYPSIYRSSAGVNYRVGGWPSQSRNESGNKILHSVTARNFDKGRGEVSRTLTKIKIESCCRYVRRISISMYKRYLASCDCRTGKKGSFGIALARYF